MNPGIWPTAFMNFLVTVVVGYFMIEQLAGFVLALGKELIAWAQKPR